MTLLAIDTTGARCGVLLRTSAGDDELEEALARGHDARLAPMAAEVLSKAGVSPHALDRVVVATGPGSFTGVRVGVAFARGLALALRIPAVGVSGLDALARTLGAAGLSAAVHDARRGEVVWRAYRDGAPLTEPATTSVADAAAALDVLRGDESLALAGSGAGLLAGEGRVDAGIPVFTLAALADLGAEADPERAPAEPQYHRPPDATPAGARPVAGGGR